MQIETPLGGFPRRSAPYQEPPTAPPEPDAGDQPGGLTAAAQKAILAGIEAGAFLETALAAVGITVNTFDDWRKRCEAGDEEALPLAEFFKAVDRAVARSELDAIKVLRTCVPNWQAMAYWLECCHPERWAKKPRGESEWGPIEHKGEID